MHTNNDKTQLKEKKKNKDRLNFLQIPQIYYIYICVF